MTDPNRPEEPRPMGDAEAVPVAVGDGVADPELAALVTGEAPADAPDEVADAPGLADAPALPPEAPVPAPPPVPAPLPFAAPVAAPVVTTARQPAVAARPRRGALYVTRRVVAFLFGVLQTLLILRIVLLLLKANPDNNIVDWIYSVTQPFVDPFLGMFQMDSVTGQKGSVLDVAAVVALIAWSLIETLIVSVLRLFDRRTR